LTEEGTAVVTVDLPEESWVVPYLFSFGKSLRILSPPRLKNRYQEEVAAIYANLTENEGAN